MWASFFWINGKLLLTRGVLAILQADGVTEVKALLRNISPCNVPQVRRRKGCQRMTFVDELAAFLDRIRDSVEFTVRLGVGRH